jgi:hypothetical protein
MAKVSNEARNTYSLRVRDYKQEIDQILSHDKTLLTALERDEEPVSIAFKRLTVAEDSLNLAALYLLLNKVSLSLLGVKNEAFLNEARKCCYDCIIQLEKVVSDYLDVPYSDYSEKLEHIESYPDERRYNLVRKLGFTIDSVKEDFGDNSKWKWSFVDLEGRYATVCKNLINLKSIIGNLDPRIEGYGIRVNFLKLTKDLLNKSADRFREKYELSTNRLDDFKMACNYLAALRRLHLVIGEPEQSENVKRKYEVWKAKMDDDAKKQESVKSS